MSASNLRGKVYVNSLEVIHPGCDGKAVTFPDVCWVPSGSSRIPVPLVNTVVGSDLKNCAATVFVQGQPIALEDSYFARSSGNEVSKSVGGGLRSGATAGPGYFGSFSPNVFIEGKAVPRHGDLVTQNHTGPVSNTPPGVWMSSMAPRPAAEPPAYDIVEYNDDLEEGSTCDLALTIEPDLYTGDHLHLSAVDSNAPHALRLRFSNTEKEQRARMLSYHRGVPDEKARLHVDLFANQANGSGGLAGRIAEMDECLAAIAKRYPDEG